jgi:hypothetical protein
MAYVRPMRPSHHADESILQVHLRQMRELDLGTAAAITTLTVKALLEAHPNAVSVLKTKGPALSFSSMAQLPSICKCDGKRS